MIELIAPLFTIAVIVIAALWGMAQQAQRFDEERAHWEKERSDLLDRIQAPDLVVHRNNANGVTPEVAPVADGPWIAHVPDDFDSKVR